MFFLVGSAFAFWSRGHEAVRAQAPCTYRLGQIAPTCTCQHTRVKGKRVNIRSHALFKEPFTAIQQKCRFTRNERSETILGGHSPSQLTRIGKEIRTPLHGQTPMNKVHEAPDATPRPTGLSPLAPLAPCPQPPHHNGAKAGRDGAAKPPLRPLLLAA